MIVNYDKENGWSSILGNNIKSFFKGSFNESDASFVKNIKTIQNSLGTISSKNIDRLANSIGGVSTELVNSAKAVRSGKQSWADFDNTVTKVTKSTSKFSSFTSKAGSVIKSIGAGIANMGVGLLAGLAIDGVITLIDNIVNYQDKLIQKGEEARSSIDSVFDAFSQNKSSIDALGRSFTDSTGDIETTGDAIDAIAKKYTELSQGINQIDNSNMSLNDEDYQSYLDISNQIAEQFPTLVAGYDAEGNALLNLGSNADSAAASLESLYNAQMLTAHTEIGDNIDDVYKGAIAQVDKYESQNYDYESVIEQYERMLEDAQNQGDTERIETLQSYINDYKQRIVANNQLISNEYDELATYAQNYLSTAQEFSNLDLSLQNALSSNLNAIDYSVADDKYNGNFKNFLNSEILVPLSEMTPEAQKSLSNILNFDPGNLGIDEYSETISKALYNAFPDDVDVQNQMKELFGFDKAIEEAEHQADALKETLGEDFSDAIDAMSLDELEKGYDIVINGDEAITTVDELRDKIEQAQALAATSVDLDVHTGMDAINTALESANAGADYESMISHLETAKDLFDKGLVGTDDFKSIASYISPTGADDPINFAENYSKALRYVTEDGKGVQNFLEDLESKGMASMETLSDGTQQWKYNIDDLQEASQKMGIGFEFMMDMFGRLEDYGFHNNFVGSIEDGSTRLTELYTQLAQEETKLAQLQAEGANTTAIEQQQEKVNALKNDINETRDAMDQLIAKSADDYAQQVDAAKQTLSSLKKERDKILKDNTYGEDTQTVADLLEQQMQQIAGENGLELDAELNIKQPETPPTIEVDTIVSKDSLDMQLSKLSSGETLKFAAEVDGNFANLEALMNQDGTVTFTANIDGVEKKVALVQNKDGTIAFTADTTEVDEETAKTDGGTRTTKYEPDTNKVDAVNAVTDGGWRSVLYSADTSGLPTYFSPITRTVNYVAQGVNAAVNAAKAAMGSSQATGTMLSPAHVSGTAYNMLNLKPAYAGGSVALPRDEKALVNEISQESIIRDGVWSLLPGGMHIESLKKGDIVLNANQTKALLQYGKAPGHARAYAQGSLLSAYAGGSGGGSFFVGGSGSSSGMSSRPSSSPLSSNKKSTSTKTDDSAQKAAKSAEKAADKFEEAFDEIEILLDRMDRTLQKLTDSIETYSYDLSKQSAMSDKAMNTIRSDLTTLQQAYNRYIKEANSVGLSNSWKKIVQSGKLDITTITDESLMDKIKEYEQWLRFLGHLIYFIAGISPQPCFATT